MVQVPLAVLKRRYSHDSFGVGGMGESMDWNKAGSAVFSKILRAACFQFQCERFFIGSPGVYLHKDSTKHKAEHYMRFVQLPSLLFYAIKWEVRTHSNFRVTVARQTDQWVQQPNSIVLAALWVCSCHHTEMIGGSSVSPAWHPLLESNPVWPQAAERVEQEDVELHPVDTHAAHRPRHLPMANSKSSTPSLSCQAAAGSFEWHFGKHGQAMPQVRQL